MLKTISAIVLFCCFVSGAAFAQTFEADVQTLIDASCIRCHDAETKTPLNMETLDYDLAKPGAFRQLVRIYDRIENREMPPRSEPRPKRAMLEKALASMKSALLEANLTARQNQRVAVRRLSRVEYEYTLHDLLGIHDELGKLLAADVRAADFDTVAAGQRISRIHVRTYLETADHALDSAIRLGKRPLREPYVFDFMNAPYLEESYDKPREEGGQIILKLDDAVGIFQDNCWTLRTDNYGYSVPYSGLYRITAEAYAYRAETSMTLLLIQGHTKQEGCGTKLLGALDLLPDEARSIEFTTFLKPEDFIYPTMAELDLPPNGITVEHTEGGAKAYEGEGLAFKSLTIQGPLVETWPPQSTRQLLTGVELSERESPDSGGVAFDMKLSKEPIEHVIDIVARLAPLAFRRPTEEGEVEFYARLAEPAIAEGRDFAEVIRIPLRAILSSPDFLLHGGLPGGLDDFALATRLSYFLWKSMPDEELFKLALFGMLSDPEVLEQQVDRMLNDEKSMRFGKDFLGQWLRLREIAATTPDERLYGGYDDVLNRALPQETELFFAELIAQNLPVKNIIDSDFTFLNRRLAEHYGISGIEGQQMRKVMLPEDSPRGGVLTQASILKLTANGSVTSPVKRGNFVVTNLLGQPPNPPPADVTIEEPDTRGTTTIREQLDKHRTLETCANCHNHIDPPGFALESFDPIGRFRTKYRTTSDSTTWLDVDASGNTEHGEFFSGIQDFKELLLEQEDEIASHFISQLVVYATGGEIEFADREEVSKIIEQTRDSGYPVRSIIHAIVQSNLFRRK